ncbi:MAG: transporter substrate-binding domain-containing protein [Oscillospiraceae bacterium]
MKKFMAMLLALVMALSLVACGQKADDTAKDDANTDNTDDSLVVLENVVDWGETEPYRVLVQKGDPKGLLEGINKAIAELTANDGALIKEIENKVASQETYTPDSVSSDLAAADEDTAASDKPVLVMGTSPDYPPYEFFADAAMTEYAGIDVEVAKYIAESMGMTLQIESMNFDNLVTSLSNGDFDMVLAACEYTEERAKACDFSDPYYTDLPPVILMKASDADKYKTVDDINQASVIIGAQKNTTKAMAAADMFPEAANGMVLESLVPTLVTELKNGTIDLLVLDGNVGLSYVG